MRHYAEIVGRSNHKTGYYVWLIGKRYWHRTLKGARRRVAGLLGPHGRPDILRIRDSRRMD